MDQQSTKPCARCHVAPRHNQSYCKACMRLFRQEALTRHQQQPSDKPCASCHAAPRNSPIPSYCMDCYRAKQALADAKHRHRKQRETCARCGEPMTGKHHAYCIACCRIQREEWLAGNRTSGKSCARCEQAPREVNMSYCRPCHRELGRASRARLGGKKYLDLCSRCKQPRDGSNPVYCVRCWRDWHLVRNFGITLDQFNVLLEKQGGRCAICDVTDPGERSWHVDHDHATGKIRGILCGSCNRGLGQLKDNPDLLRRAVEYLKASR